MTLSTSYWPADRSQPVLGLAVGDALRDAAAEAPHTAALVERAVDPAELELCRLPTGSTGPAQPDAGQQPPDPGQLRIGALDRSGAEGYPGDPQWRCGGQRFPEPR